MSGHKNTPKAPLAEWRVITSGGNHYAIPASRMARDKSGGYSFTDDLGPVADFPPMTVVSVERMPAAAEAPAG